jgi:hypothetical protein
MSCSWYAPRWHTRQAWSWVDTSNDSSRFPKKDSIIQLCKKEKLSTSSSTDCTPDLDWVRHGTVHCRRRDGIDSIGPQARLVCEYSRSNIGMVKPPEPTLISMDMTEMYCYFRETTNLNVERLDLQLKLIWSFWGIVSNSGAKPSVGHQAWRHAGAVPEVMSSLWGISPTSTRPGIECTTSRRAWQHVVHPRIRNHSWVHQKPQTANQLDQCSSFCKKHYFEFVWHWTYNPCWSHI